MMSGSSSAASSTLVKRPAELGYGRPSGRLGAMIVEDNTILVDAHHVRRFRLHLADGMVDLAKPLRVVVNGEVAFEGRATAGSTGYVLQEAARQVGGPLYRAFVDVTL